MTKKIIVDYNKDAEKVHAKQLADKQRIGKEAIEHISGFVTVDISDFLNDMKGTFEKTFNEQYKEAFSQMILFSKRLELVGFDITRLLKLQAQFEAINIPLDAELNPIEKPDFNIYISDAEKIKQYNDKIELLKAIDTYQKNDGNVLIGNIQKAFPEAFLYDYATQEFKPTY